MKNIDYSVLISIESMMGEDDEETQQLNELYKTAVAFMASFRWSGEIVKVYFGIGVADIIAVFLVELIPPSSDIDRCLWVVVGDVPPAYLVVDISPTPACALAGYINEMHRWADAVESGKSLEDCIPVNAVASLANAASLRSRLRFIEREILPWHKCDFDSESMQ